MGYNAFYKLLKNKTLQLKEVTATSHWRRIGDNVNVESL